MIRKIAIFTVLVVTLAAAIVLPFWKSDAAQQRSPEGSHKDLQTALYQTSTFVWLAGANSTTWTSVRLRASNARWRTLSLALALPRLNNFVRL